MYIARKVTDLPKFIDWRISEGHRFEVLMSKLDDFSSIIDYDESSRALKRRVHKLYRDQFELVLIFREVCLFPHLLAFNSIRNMALDNRWRRKI